MSLESILLGLALLVIVALFLARPLLKPAPRTSSISDRRRELERDKEAYLDEIRSLDFDHETGKVPTEVYEQQRAHLVQEAAVVYKALDELPAAGGDVYAQVEAAIAARRQQVAHAGNGQVGFCTNCGQPHDAGDKFCAHCGQPLRIAEPVS
jgi:hypothetical protein